MCCKTLVCSRVSCALPVSMAMRPLVQQMVDCPLLERSSHATQVCVLHVTVLCLMLVYLAGGVLIIYLKLFIKNNSVLKINNYWKKKKWDSVSKITLLGSFSSFQIFLIFRELQRASIKWSLRILNWTIHHKVIRH